MLMPLGQVLLPPPLFMMCSVGLMVLLRLSDFKVQMSHSASVVGGGEDIVSFSVFKKALKQMNSPVKTH